jgi:hypothetical protein
MKSTDPTGSARVCYDCASEHGRDSMFCPECLPERMPPIIREKPTKPPRIGLWTAILSVFRYRGHIRAHRERIAALERDLRQSEEMNEGLRRMLKQKGVALEELTKAFDDCDSERSKALRQLTALGIHWGHVVAQAEKMGWNPNSDTVGAAAQSTCPIETQEPKDPDAIAEGHNPHRVSNAVVGEGWRLLTTKEIKLREITAGIDKDPNLEMRIRGEWIANCRGTSTIDTYRVRI